MAEKRDARLSRRADRRAAKLMVAQPELPRPEKEEVSAAAVVAAQPELPRSEKGEVIAVTPDTGITTHTSNLGTHDMPPPVSSYTQRKEEKRQHRQQRWEEAQAQQQRPEQLGLLAHQPSHPSLQVHTWGMTAKEWQTARRNYVALHGKPGCLEWKPNFMFTWGRLELVKKIYRRLRFIVTAKSRWALFHFRVNHRLSTGYRPEVQHTVAYADSDSDAEVDPFNDMLQCRQDLLEAMAEKGAVAKAKEMVGIGVVAAAQWAFFIMLIMAPIVFLWYYPWFIPGLLVLAFMAYDKRHWL
jgi:hypothetical protein